MQDNSRRWLAFAVILSANLLSVLDFLIVNIALPSIRREMGATDGQMQLTVAGYGLVFAVCLITGGRLGDIYGRKKLFMIGMAGFTCASALCGFAQTPNQLVLFRIVQGFVAAMMTPQVLATIQVTFVGRERDTATGMVGAVVGVGSFLGNVVGGYLVGANLFGLGWRPIFFVNVPIGIIALVMAYFLVPESSSPTAKKLDIPGAVISALGLFLLIFPIAEGRESGWPWWAFVMIGGSFVLAYLFVQYEKYVAAVGGSPLVDLELFASGGFGLGLLSILLVFSGVSSFSFTLTYFLQQGLGVAPNHVGLIFSALSIAFLLASILAVQVVGKIGPRTLLIGISIMQVGQLLLIALPLIWGARLNPYVLMPVLFLYGIGQGLAVPQVIRQTLNQVGVENAGAASGVLQTTQQIAFSLGVSVVGAVFFAFAEGGNGDAYGRGLAAAFVCNFAFILTARFFIAANIKRNPQPLSNEVPEPVLVEM